jgi:RNA polymerase sigma-70 factor (ECF subfamily)
VADEHERARAIKRGGAVQKLPFDFERAEGQYVHSLAHDMSPEKLFERSWALTILQKTMDLLEVEFASMNKQTLFATLSTYLGGQGTNIPYHDVAAELNMTEGAVKVAVHRLRRRYRELLRNEIAQTVAAEDQIDEEIKGLFEALA